MAVWGLNVKVELIVAVLPGSGHDMSCAITSFLKTTVESLITNDVATSVSTNRSDWAGMLNLQMVLALSMTQIVMPPPIGIESIPPHEFAAGLDVRCSANGVTEFAVVVQKMSAVGKVGLVQIPGSSDVTSARVCVIGT